MTESPATRPEADAPAFNPDRAREQIKARYADLRPIAEALGPIRANRNIRRSHRHSVSHRAYR